MGGLSRPRPWIDVRPARFPDDAPTVRALFVEYAATLDVDLCFQDFDDELRTLPGRYVPAGGGVWLAFDGDAPAACIALRPLDGGRGEMKRLYVRPSYRGCGLGRRLAETVLAASDAAGHREVVLDTLPQMDGAIALYRALGFEATDAYCVNPVPGALFLRRLLDQSCASIVTIAESSRR